MNRNSPAVGVGAVLVLLACVGFIVLSNDGTRRGKERYSVSTIESIPVEHWDALATSRVFFGHQSVGENVIDGVRDVADEHPDITLGIVEADDGFSRQEPSLFHFKVGHNMRPETKLAHFAEIMAPGRDSIVDIALVKFCYVDVRHDTDPQALFDRYRQTISEFREHHPETTVVHVTVPLESAPVGISRMLKGRVKRLIRRPGVVEDNRTRHRYNQLLRTSFADSEPVFDLARFESIGPTGTSTYVVRGSERIPMMDARYTDDGGHLNGDGRRRTAEQLLIVLAQAANARSAAGKSSR